ncbi:plasmid pRiA4b ORF-3 family protein [Candidatus Contubernalis alkaliaceticus]|uniref:plasmid pRiA4b ORF-3 family protein n=1 Tax=Candidatus Contubernalis alkaliaceticus TaxID=338645 RepID=UPI001F4BF465|nr:plasmid pRiA4b ORF-3 family protein [Candidatus Contubernalis alkalaceticus]UNC91237.1 plasmid pRiA4b ORF-3 family protein [Candidatus Contubernalis alkalaceticus]
MQICLTKKLQSELGVAVENGSEDNDFFCWSANLITVNRRKTVVVVNDSNRFGFVLQGLKAKDFKIFRELVTEGIKKCLRDEKIKEETIERYIQSAGDPVFTKTRGRSYVARLNKACEYAGYFGDLFDPDIPYQKRVSDKMNNDYITVREKKEYEHPHILLLNDFEKFAGDPVISCEAVDLMVKLNLNSSTAWRRIVTPVDITFNQLHEILQVAFDWNSSHLYNFRITDESGQCVVEVVSEYEDMDGSFQDCETLLDYDVSLRDYLGEQYKIVYLYDYGDNWEHEIKEQRVIAGHDNNYPVCIMGEGNAPPEDVGGVHGYEEFLKIIADPQHEEHKSTLTWARSQWHRDFDIDIVNRRLRIVLRQ